MTLYNVHLGELQALGHLRGAEGRGLGLLRVGVRVGVT